MKDIINTFDLLCLPHKEYCGKNDSLKLEKLKELLDNEGVEYEYNEKQGLIVNKQEKPKKVIVSHMDLIQLFNSGFKEDQKFKVSDKCITGALDNTITNAVMLLTIKKLKEDNMLEGTEFLFSEAEEIGFYGVRDYLHKNANRLKDSFFINLDVTNEGYGYSASVEYDCCNFENLKKIQKLNQNFFYTMDREGDDMCEIKRQGYHGFSYCLPTKKGIHSYRNKARLDSLEPYLNGLLLLIKEDLISADQDIYFDNFKKALKSDNKPKRKKKKESSYSTWDSLLESDRNPFVDSNDLEMEELLDRTLYNDSFHNNDEDLSEADKAYRMAENLISVLTREMLEAKSESLRELASDNFFKNVLFENALNNFINGKYYIYKDDIIVCFNSKEDFIDFLKFVRARGIFYIENGTLYLTDHMVDIIKI